MLNRQRQMKCAKNCSPMRSREWLEQKCPWGIPLPHKSSVARLGLELDSVLWYPALPSVLLFPPYGGVIYSLCACVVRPLCLDG